MATHLMAPGRPTGLRSYAPREQIDLLDGPTDLGQTLVALVELNASLILCNRALRRALERQGGSTGAPSEDLRLVPVVAPPLVGLRLVRGQAWREAEATRAQTCMPGFAGLTARQVQVLNLVLAGHPSKNIAIDLDISQRTVENHRAAIMKRTGATSLPALARMAVGASGSADRKCKAPRQPGSDALEQHHYAKPRAAAAPSD